MLFSGARQRRKGSDDLFKARIASEGIPLRMETQLAVVHIARRFHDGGKLIKGEILFARPGIDEGEIFHKARPTKWFLRQRGQLDRAPALTNGIFFATEGCINQSKDRPAPRVLGLPVYCCLRWHARGGKSGLGRDRVVPGARRQALEPGAGKTPPKGRVPSGFHGGQSAIDRDGVTLAKAEVKPLLRKARRRGRISGDGRLDRFVQRSGIGSPDEVDRGPVDPQVVLVREQSDGAIPKRGRFRVTALKQVDRAHVPEIKRIARVELQGSFIATHRLLPAPLAAIEMGQQSKNPRLIGKGALGHGQLRPRAIVIERMVAIFRPQKMDLPRIGPQSRRRRDRRLGQGEPARRAIHSHEVKRAVRARQLAIGEKEFRVAGDGLIEQAGRL